jgi:TolB protein
MRFAPLAAGLALLLAGCGGSSPATIAFTTTRNGNAEVYVMHDDGSDLVDLTPNLSQNGEPAWSPNGKEIAFVSARAGNTQIYTMKPNGTDVLRLTHKPTGDMDPVWSPDGQKIAYECTTAIPSIVTEICVVDSDGGGELQLTKRSQHDNLYPHWSPDGKDILFTSMRSGTQVFSVPATGGAQRELLAGVQGSAEAVYSPNGKQIAILTIRDASWVVDVVNADLTGRREILGGHGDADTPVWSPNGKQIACEEGGNVWVVNADGSDARKLTDGPGNSLSPQWSADGKRIAFERLHGDSSDVYVVGVDGAGLRNLTNAVGKNGGPVWQP